LCQTDTVAPRMGHTGASAAVGAAAANRHQAQLLRRGQAPPPHSKPGSSTLTRWSNGRHPQDPQSLFTCGARGAAARQTRSTTTRSGPSSGSRLSASSARKAGTAQQHGKQCQFWRFCCCTHPAAGSGCQFLARERRKKSGTAKQLTPNVVSSGLSLHETLQQRAVQMAGASAPPSTSIHHPPPRQW
jgi:hypothetical protein